MSALLQCMATACSLNTFLSLLLDVFAPIGLEILFIGLIFDKVMERRERNRWIKAQAVLVSRLLRVQDELLLDLVPDRFRKVDVVNVAVSGINVDLLFSWRNNEPDSESMNAGLLAYIEGNLEVIRQTISAEREKINQIIQAHSAHIEPDLFGILLEIDADLAKVEVIDRIQGDNTNDYLEAINKCISDVLKLRTWLFDSKEVNPSPSPDSI